MHQRQRIEEWFGRGRLVRPRLDVASFTDLVRTMARLAGAEDVPEDGPAPAAATGMARLIGPADHYVLVLVDGLGVNLLNGASSTPFLRSHRVATLQSVFLSTTAAALTTLATGLWPSQHGVPGWWTWLDDRDLSIVTLPYTQRGTDRPLGELGVEPHEVFPVPSMWGRMGKAVRAILPAKMLDSVYTRYSTAGAQRDGYETLPQAAAMTAQAVLQADRPSLTYLYLPQLDAAGHRLGYSHEQTRRLLTELDTLLAGLAQTLSGRARVVITADHGQVDVPPSRKFILSAGDPLLAELLAPPSAEPAVPVFHVRPGREAAFAEAFLARFGEHFALLTPDEIEDMALMGPGPLSATTRRRLGSFMGIAPDPAVLLAAPCAEEASLVGFHGGMRPAEMHVPLILA